MKTADVSPLATNSSTRVFLILTRAYSDATKNALIKTRIQMRSNSAIVAIRKLSHKKAKNTILKEKKRHYRVTEIGPYAACGAEIVTLPDASTAA